MTQFTVPTLTSSWVRSRWWRWIRDNIRLALPSPSHVQSITSLWDQGNSYCHSLPDKHPVAQCTAWFYLITIASINSRSAECEPGGRWSLGSTLPTCKPIECQAPRAPRHGMIHPGFPGQEVFKVGDIVKFHCETGFMMQGSPVSACTDSSSWSRPPPRCVTACTYPGTTSGGIIDKVKFYYEIGETVRFSCSPGHELSGNIQENLNFKIKLL